VGSSASQQEAAEDLRSMRGVNAASEATWLAVQVTEEAGANIIFFPLTDSIETA